MLFNLKHLLMAMPVALMAFASCKKDSDSGASNTLNKSTLTTKAWYNKGGSIIHDFKPKGIYSNTGTWKWVGSSDTLEIKATSNSSATYWKMLWNTDSEMSCQRVGTPSPELYKSQLWN